jgi:hypothetical protein
MARRKRGPTGPSDQTDWENERTLADAEAEKADGDGAPASDSTCPCGSHEFALEAYFHVVDGVMRPEPLDIESLTCPHCGREYEAIRDEAGKYLRGDFRGYVDVDED